MDSHVHMVMCIRTCAHSPRMYIHTHTLTLTYTHILAHTLTHTQVVPFEDFYAMFLEHVTKQEKDKEAQEQQAGRRGRSGGGGSGAGQWPGEAPLDPDSAAYLALVGSEFHKFTTLGSHSNNLYVTRLCAHPSSPQPTAPMTSLSVCVRLTHRLILTKSLDCFYFVFVSVFRLYLFCFVLFCFVLFCFVLHCFL